MPFEIPLGQAVLILALVLVIVAARCAPAVISRPHSHRNGNG
jgi:hypothetical protein